MTAQDRELLYALNRRHAQLENSLGLLKADIAHLRARLEAPAPLPPVLPPLPVFEPQAELVTPPPLPFTEEPPPMATATPPFIPPTPEAAPVQEPLSLEFQFGRWLARIGVVFALVTLISFSVLVYHYMGAWSKLAVLAAASLGLIGCGFWLERRSADMLVYARTLAGGGLACLYYTIYGATFVEPLRVIPSPLFGGFLLLAWSAWVLWLAEKRKSELLSVFAIALAYFSSAIMPVGGFTMAANLILAATAVIFLIRNAWTGLSYLCLIGTYAGFLRQVVANRADAPFDYQWLPIVSFWPLAIYLIGAWLIFTAGIFLAQTPAFANGKRMAFLCLNNGAFAGLILVAEHLSHYGHVGGILGATGAAFLACSLLTRAGRPTETDLTGAYLMQGLALGTGGIAVAYTGVTRGLLLTIESVFLAGAGAWSRNVIFRMAAAACAVLAVFHLVVEITQHHFAYTLTFGGALAMLANAWLARREFWSEPRETARWVWTSAYYIILAFGLLAFGIGWHAPDNWVPVDLAVVALVLTFVVYLIPLFELPPLAQLVLLLAQAIAFVPPLFPDAGSAAAPDWSRNLVALATMILATWWPRQNLARTAAWLQPLLFVYALAMVAFSYSAIEPHVTAQTWMIAASVLSLAFLAYGIGARVWMFALAGQLLLALSIGTFLGFPNPFGPFPWTGWASAVPVIVVFATGWLAHAWLPGRLSADENSSVLLRVIGRIYQCVAAGLLIRWIFGVVPATEQTLALLAVGTALLLLNTLRPGAFGARMALLFDLVGGLNYLTAFGHPLPFTWTDTAGFTLLLAQPGLLRRWGATLLTEAEGWLLVLGSSALAWLYVSNGADALGSHNLTLAWALFAVALLVIGFIAHERRQRWAGLAILVAAMVRVACYDFWHLTEFYKMLTFLALTVICLGLSFLYYKFSDRLKDWL